jgi:hypothetical protein
MWDNPKPQLEAIRSGIKNRENIDWKSDSTLGNLIRGLAYAINQEIIHTESKDWANPSPARVKVIQKWGEVLRPYTKELLALAMEEGKIRYDSSTQARSILDFAEPSEEFASEVRKYMIDTNYRSTWEAADLLFEHRLLSEADKNIIRQSMASIKIEGHKIDFAQNMRRRYGITDWDDMLIENAKMILESRPDKNTPDDIANFYGSALETARLLKTKAHILALALDELLGYLEKNCPRCIPFFKSTRDSVLGLTTDHFEPELAKNGSGPLTVKIGDAPQPKTQDDQPIKDTSLERSEKSRSAVDSKSSDAITEKSAPFPWWLIVSSGAILALALVAWLKARKSKYNSK